MVKDLDIPDHDGMEDEAFPALPPPQSPGLGGQEDGDPFTNDGDTSKLAEVPAAKRKGVKRPQPKLDSNRLISERGLPALRTLFDGVKFKGKGHEAENLQLLMQKMENWAHRLFPKLQFEDFIDKVERLGSKKEVQTCLKRIRLDMPLTHEDFMGNDGEEAAAPESHVFDDPDPFSRGRFPDELPGPIHSTPAPAAAAAPPPPATPSLSEEQQRRMELNRQRALERRLARQQQQRDPSDSQPVETSLLEDQPSSDPSANALNNSKGQDGEKEVEEEDLDLQSVNNSKGQDGEKVVEEEDLDLQSVNKSKGQDGEKVVEEEDLDLQPVNNSKGQDGEKVVEEEDLDLQPVNNSKGQDGEKVVEEEDLDLQPVNKSKGQDGEKEVEEEELDLQPVSSSTQHSQLSPKDSESSDPPAQCEGAESSSPIHQPSTSCEDGD